MPTIKEIADFYGISRSTARRRVLECFPDKQLEVGRATVLDDDEASALADFMSARAPLRTCPEQAGEADEQDAGPMNSPADAPDVQALVDAAVREAVQAQRVEQLERELDAATARCASLEFEISRLHEELGRLHDALQREQARTVRPLGFWSRLGQRLLGDGSGE